METHNHKIERKTYSADEAFALLGMKRSTGFDALKNGTFPVKPIRVGKRYYIPRAPLDALLSDQRDTGAAA